MSRTKTAQTIDGRTSAPTYAVIPAPGHFGDWAPVVSTHRTLTAARKAARSDGTLKFAVVERPGARKGDRIHRTDVRVVE